MQAGFAKTIKNEPNYPDLLLLRPRNGDYRFKRSCDFVEGTKETTDPLTLELALMTRRIAHPARYPPTGTWPALMRADMAAAYLDYRDTAELARAVGRGEAPPPIGYHGVGRAREPVWSKAMIDKLTARALAASSDHQEGQDLATLV
jgi:hypothetical protein